jgi:hypothetical protein
MGAVYDSRHFIPITVSDNGVRSIPVVFIGLYGKARLSLIERALLILFYYVLIHMNDSLHSHPLEYVLLILPDPLIENPALMYLERDFFGQPNL